MFRVEDDRIAETWLPAMGVHAPMAYPRPETAWADSAIPDQNQSQLSPNKSLIKNWYHDLAIGQDVTRHLAPTVGWHDMHDANLELAPDALQSRLRDLMQGDLAEGLKLHLIEGGDFVADTCVWSLGEDKRRWNWIQVFEIKNGLIVRSWINGICGTDPSITYGTNSA